MAENKRWLVIGSLLLVVAPSPAAARDQASTARQAVRPATSSADKPGKAYREFATLMNTALAEEVNMARMLIKKSEAYLASPRRDVVGSYMPTFSAMSVVDSKAFAEFEHIMRSASQKEQTSGMGVGMNDFWRRGSALLRHRITTMGEYQRFLATDGKQRTPWRRALRATQEEVQAYGALFRSPAWRLHVSSEDARQLVQQVSVLRATVVQSQPQR